MERSENGRLFTRLFTVPVITTNAASHTYNATDASPLEGVSYYRIKEVDKNGNISFSHVVAVDAEGLNSATAYPTPAHNAVFVNIKTVAQTTVLNMYDTQGKLVDQKHVLLKNGNNMVRWDVNRLSPGLYFIRGGKTGMEVTIIKQ